jgi:hypothetical protein
MSKLSQNYKDELQSFIELLIPRSSLLRPKVGKGKHRYKSRATI